MPRTRSKLAYIAGCQVDPWRISHVSHTCSVFVRSLREISGLSLIAVSASRYIEGRANKTARHLRVYGILRSNDTLALVR